MVSAANRFMPKVLFAAVSNASVLTTHVLIWWSETYLIELCLHLFISSLIFIVFHALQEVSACRVVSCALNTAAVCLQATMISRVLFSPRQNTN